MLVWPKYAPIETLTSGLLTYRDWPFCNRKVIAESGGMEAN